MDTFTTFDSPYYLPGSDADCPELCEECSREMLWTEVIAADWRMTAKHVLYMMCPECEELLKEEAERDIDDYDDRDGYDRLMFSDPGGKSALRAETPDNPRNLPCPNCEAPNRLTPLDRSLGYQCDACADRAEQGGY